MCGIIGIISKNKIDRSLLHESTNLLSHRGPDSKGEYISPEGTLGFGHVRLSLVDLADRSNQPMTKHNLILIFNGEIFNFKDINKELEGLGYIFSTTSDTETVITAFHHWGPKCVNKFNGFFAFAIYNTISKETYIFRDRIGVKQLVYTQTRDSFIFSSETKSILNFPDVNRNPNIETIYTDLIFTFWGDKKETIFKGVHHLEAGNYIKVVDNKATFHKYWDIEMNVSNNVLSSQNNYEEIVEELYSLLTDSVKLRLMADCKVGTLLSGGLDSSLITKIAADLNISKMDAFTLKYDDETNDDLIKAKLLVSQNDKVRHHLVNVTKRDINIDLIDKVTYHMEELLFDKAYISIFKNYESARELNIKAVLNGQGSDEVWLGYYFFYPFMQYKNEMLDMPNFSNYWSNNFFLKEFSDMKTTNKLILKNLNDNYLPYLGEDKLNSLVGFGIKTHMQSMLMQEDRLSMASGVECRVPFVDYRIIELATKIPSNIKVLDGREKFLLRKVGEKMLPREIYNRRKEVFPIPPHKYDDLGEKLINTSEVLQSKIIKEITKIDTKSFNLLPFNQKWKLFALSRLENVYFK